MNIDTTRVLWIADTPAFAAYFAPTGLVSKGDGSQVETFIYSSGDPLLNVNHQQIR